MTVLSLEDGRYDRQQRIEWWDQDALTSASVLVVGAGALGNELVKDLALVGVGRIIVVDMDVVEHSNLARCVLFRDGDEGQSKARLVAERAQQLNPEVAVEPVVGRIERMGVGALAKVDVVVGGLDSREARAWVNQAARKVNRPWVDGAIEGIRGIARVFLPSGPCYECTLGEIDRQIMARRKSCALLSEQEMLEGKVPTNATTAALIAAVEVQEAIKLLHGRIDLVGLAGRAFVFVGETAEAYAIDYVEDPDCLAHETYGPLEPAAVAVTETLQDLAQRFGAGPATAIELEDEAVVGTSCARCGATSEPMRLLGALDRTDLECPCGELAAVDLRRRFAVDDPLATAPMGHLGLAAADVVTLRSPEVTRHLVVEVKR